MKNLSISNAVVMIFFVISFTGVVCSEEIQANEKSNLAVNLEFVEKWPELSPEDSNLPQITKTHLINELEKSIKARQAFKSWEAKYKIIFQQFQQQNGNRSDPEIINFSDIRIVSNGNKSYYKEQSDEKTGAQDSVDDTFIVSNGQKIFEVWPDRKEGNVRSVNEGISSEFPTICDFLPAMPLELKLRGTGFPEILDIIKDSDTKLLPWRTRINDQICYVLELTSRLQHPLLKSEKELDEWKTANPEMAKKWEKAGKLGLTIVINDKREVELTQRLAIAPNLGFAIVRWAYGYETNNGYIHLSIFPNKEINYIGFRQIRQGLYIPYNMTYTTYLTDGQSEKQLNKFQEIQINLQEIEFDKQYSPEVFDINFPKGYKIMDFDKNISYTVGDSNETINALTDAAMLREEFYKNLKLKEAPALEYSKWINSEPISLDDCKGKKIILHFWGCNCAPCLSELSQLQEQYGQQTSYPSPELFISLHQYVDGDDLDQLNETINEYGITFPVMIDAPDPENLSWGKTYRKYMVFAIPTEVKIDKNGHFEEIDKAPVDTESHWIENSKD